MPIAAAQAGLTTVLLGSTPDEFRGRVMSTLVVADASAQAAGTLLAGVLIGVVGLLPLLQAHAGLGLAAGVVALVHARRGASGQYRNRTLARTIPGPYARLSSATSGLSPSSHQPSPAGRIARLTTSRSGPAREAGDDEVPGPDRAARPDQECVPVPQGRHHRRADHAAPGGRASGVGSAQSDHGSDSEVPPMRLSRLLAPRTVAHAHCDLPCGVYDPAQARIEAESVKAIMEKYQGNEDPVFRTRALIIKEQRAELVKHHLWVLWTDYFKPPHFEKYPQLHELFNKATKQAGAAGGKGSVDPAEGQQLLDSIAEIDKIFWETKQAA